MRQFQAKVCFILSNLIAVIFLQKTDICEHALNVLRESKVKQVYVIGRRGPLQVCYLKHAIANVAVQCRSVVLYTIGCCCLNCLCRLNYLMKISQTWWSIVQVVFCNKLSWFVSELPEKNISNMVVQCGQYSTISCRGLCLNYVKKIAQTWWSSVGTISCRGLCLNYQIKIKNPLVSNKACASI